MYPGERLGFLDCTAEEHHPLYRNEHASHEGVQHQCPSCPATFGYKTVAERHFKVIHQGVRHKCPECIGTFNFTGSVARHFDTAHLHKRYKSSDPRCVASPNSLKVHHDAVHKGDRFYCRRPICDNETPYKTSKARNANEKSHDGVRYQCRYCPQQYAHTKSRSCHELKEHR
ncbi:hypothetical protein L198_05935 [Cryptococcus wingfieldii CBS 7118]|uniref:C2H2-type domain-containing protein n=1 Tax=Cryptococcus wingfieldii CBS 7118 TaxID=1295528 RepID=A0A1E3IUN0_9TREE|nr:hypothetical protein L198_05935 [Cryptococcus wingfieldii CBS 7118]ODN91421.1 hypothetical protein L198_05935 [Cryptococcus wingfieldii CBS 7118]